MISFLLLLLFCYAAGAVPTSYLLVRGLLGKDIRRMGSGNSGATNTGRFLGMPGFVFVLVIDALKAYLALVLTAFFIGHDPLAMCLATVAVYLGNAYSPFIGFAGGKGVATTVGIMLYLFPLWLFFACFCLFGFLAYRFGRVDVASLGSSLAAPVLLWSAGHSVHVVVCALLITCWVWLRHASNIMALWLLWR